MGETAPNILVLGSLFDHLQALEDVYDVVDPPPLHVQVGLDLVQLQQHLTLTLVIFNKLLAERLQAALFPVKSEDLHLQGLELLLRVLGGWSGGNHPKDGASSCYQLLNQPLGGVFRIRVDRMPLALRDRPRERPNRLNRYECFLHLKFEIALYTPIRLLPFPAK
jgi:hypothetical protein